MHYRADFAFYLCTGVKFSGILKMCLKKYEEAKQCFDAANSLEVNFFLSR